MSRLGHHDPLLYQSQLNDVMIYNDLIRNYVGHEAYEEALQAFKAKEKIKHEQMIINIEKYFIVIPDNES